MQNQLVLGQGNNKYNKACKDIFRMQPCILLHINARVWKKLFFHDLA